jgi:hypothetical protein
MKYLMVIIVFILFNACDKGIISKQERLIDDPQLVSMGYSNWTYGELLDSIGNWHNLYQEYLLSSIVKSKVNLIDTAKLKNIINTNSIDFFQTKGLKYSNAIDALDLGKPTILNFKETPNGFSIDAKEIVDDLQKVINNFDGYTPEFKEKISQLENKVLMLKNNTELISVGVPVFIAKHSYAFWDKSGTYWFNALATKNIIHDENNSINSISRQVELKAKSCNVNLYKLGGADVSGAVGGAYAGAALGPGGALAGAVLVSSTASLGNLTNQVIDCYVSWWPF